MTFFIFFRIFSGSIPNFKKSEIAGIGALKGIQVAVCGLRCIELNNDILKILCTQFSYNEKLKEEKKDCNRYSTSIKYMENDKPYFRRENCYCYIKNYFPIIYKNCPKTYYK